MAAPNEHLADPNAFIITDEETVIPAAPPADEVVVTSVKEEDSLRQMTSEPLQEETVAADPLLNTESKETLTQWVSSVKPELIDPDASQTSFLSLDPADQYLSPSAKPESTPFDVQLMDPISSLNLQGQENMNPTSVATTPNGSNDNMVGVGCLWFTLTLLASSCNT